MQLLQRAMLLAQCTVSLTRGQASGELHESSGNRHAANSVINANGDDMRLSGPGAMALTPNGTTAYSTISGSKVSSETRIVYLIGGQSQASGKGLTSELTNDERDRAAALGHRVVVLYPKMDLNPEHHAELSDALEEEHRVGGGSWRRRNSVLQSDPHTELAARISHDPRIEPGASTLGEIASGSKGCTFGPEVSFGLRMAEAMPSRRITIIKVSWPGLNITTYRRALYPTVLSSLRRFEEAHGKFELGGMLWLHGEFDAGFNEPDFLSTNVTVSLALLEPRGSPKRKSLEPHCDPNPPRQYAAADDYGNQLQSLVQDLRADTGVQVPFATLSMRIFHASWSLHHQPHNVNVVNRGMQDAASALERVYVVKGQTRKLSRYFDEPQHCVSSDVQAHLGWLWTASFARLCKHPHHLVGGGCKNEAQWATAKGIPACMPNQDLHFTARGQIGVGTAFAHVFGG